MRLGKAASTWYGMRYESHDELEFPDMLRHKPPNDTTNARFGYQMHALEMHVQMPVKSSSKQHKPAISFCQ